MRKKANNITVAVRMDADLASKLRQVARDRGFGSTAEFIRSAAFVALQRIDEAETRQRTERAREVAAKPLFDLVTKLHAEGKEAIWVSSKDSGRARQTLSASGLL